MELSNNRKAAALDAAKFEQLCSAARAADIQHLMYSVYLFVVVVLFAFRVGHSVLRRTDIL